MLAPRMLWALALACLALAAGATLAQTAPPAASLSRADSAFLKQTAENGHMEIEGSRLALEKATAPQVRAFAQTMVTDHQRVGNELKALARSKGVEVSDEPSLVQRTRVKLLSTNDGDELARRYVQMLGVEAHQETIELFEKAASNATDPDVKAFAAKTLPGLQHHLSQARELQAALDAKRP